jgi:regulator of replication initiation timing
MIDWLYSLKEETKQIIERTNQLKKENERLRKETETLRSVTPEKLSEIVKKSMRRTPDELAQGPSTGVPDAL